MQVVCSELNISERFVMERLALLYTLVPDLTPQLSSLKLADMIRLAADAGGVVDKLLMLRDAWPHANVSRVVAANPQLLRMSASELSANLQEVEQLLSPAAPPEAWQQLLEQAPDLSHAAVLRGVLTELERLFGSSQGPARIPAMLVQNPGLALSCQSLSGQSRGDRDTSYVEDWLGAAAEGAGK